MFFSFKSNSNLPNIRRLNFCNFSSKWIHESRITDEYVFYIIVEGNMYIQEKNTKYHLKKGDLLFLEPGIKHFGYKNAAVKYYYFHFHKDVLINKHLDFEEINKNLIDNRHSSIESEPFSRENPFSLESLYFPKHFNIKDQSSLIQITNLLSESQNDIFSKKEHYKISSSSKVISALVLISREYTSSLLEKDNPEQFSNKTTFILNKLITYIKSNYNQELNIDTIEAFMEFNYNYLNTLLKKSHRMTIGKLIQSVRIEEAKKLIQNTDLNFKTIAFRVGINDPYYFSKLFKSITGITPSKYAESVLYSK